MEKYVKIGVLAIVMAAVAIVGGIIFAGNSEEGSQDKVEELNLDEEVEEEQVDISRYFNEEFALTDKSLMIM